jgi:hypothetical protein
MRNILSVCSSVWQFCSQLAEARLQQRIYFIQRREYYRRLQSIPSYDGRWELILTITDGMEIN